VTAAIIAPTVAAACCTERPDVVGLRAVTTDDTEAALEQLADADRRTTAARRMRVVVNPYATTTSDRLKQLVVYALQGRFAVDVAETEHKEHATELAREAVEAGYDVVCAFGGDGTVNEVANGLAGSPTVLTCLPGGATNVYHRMIGIPRDVVDATEHLLRLADDWHPRAFDIARVNDRWFTFAAGAGLDASVVERVDSRPRLKARFGPLFYAQSATATFLRDYVRDPPVLLAEIDGVEYRGVTVAVQNTQPYTYAGRRPVTLSEGATLSSGDLSGAVLERANPLDLPTMAYRLLAGNARVGDHRRVQAFDGVHGLRVRSADGRTVPLQVDGDYIGAHVEAVFTVLPGGLQVVG
jgi:diacylglycerol kinase family enzyme